MEPLFFAKPADFRRWLEKHHHSATELLVGFYKKGSGRPSMTWPESVDEALCFGWIDGVRRSLDDESYTIRFTPRRPGSNWSLINIRKVKALIRGGRMKPAGLEAFKARDDSKSGVYSFEQRENAKLDRKAEATFRANRAAWRFFQAQPPGYRKIAAFYVMSAKREETRTKRLNILIEYSAAGQRIGIQPRAREESGK
jgi:uncharacterized protein YdeI (YjbR/CyaY-like superfamily)